MARPPFRSGVAFFNAQSTFVQPQRTPRLFLEAVDQARRAEALGFESFWVPEHTHIPSSRKSAYPAGGGLIRPYYDIMDPFLVLTAVSLLRGIEETFNDMWGVTRGRNWLLDSAIGYLHHAYARARVA